VKASIAVTHGSPSTKPTTVIVDLGYQDVDQQVPGIEVIHRGKTKRLSVRQ
jgi:hypothetical protein